MKKNLLLALGLSALIISSCKKDDTPSEKPVVACFTSDFDSATVNETITFTNCSKEATTYSWDFGDGSTAVATNPTHAYANKGTYTVKLKAHSSFGTSSNESTHKVFIGDRYFRGFRLNQMPAKNSSGGDWDSDGSGPDIFVSFYPTADPGKVKGSEIRDNTTAAKLPVTWFSINSVPYDEKSSNEEWTLIVGDEDGGNVETMNVFKFNGVTGARKIKSGEWDIDLVFNHKP